MNAEGEGDAMLFPINVDVLEALAAVECPSAQRVTTITPERPEEMSE